MILTLQTWSLRTRFLALLTLLFPVVVFQWLLMGAPWALAHLKVVAHGAGVPDQNFWYTPDTLVTLFATWGSEGRAVYFGVLWPTDLGFLLAYGAFLTAATLYLLKKANPARVWWYLLPLVPIAAAAADFLENVFVAWAAWLPERGWEAVSWLAAAFTASKWVACGLSFAILVFGAVVTLGRSVWARWRRVR